MFDPLDSGLAFRRAHQLQDQFVALYAGAHGMSNDLDVVLDAAKLLEAEGHIRIVLLGDGKEKANLQARAAELRLDNVLFLPSVSKIKMGAVLAGADACIAILKPIEAYKTTYPNKVFDYMAAGRPVVLAIQGVIQQVVEQADCGVFPQPGNAQDMANAIAYLAADHDRAVKLGINGRRYLEEHFSREVLATRLETVLRELSDD
jgi:glycosyltransferase involved in cell wall biosynthesis